jgi:uncharacterized protein YqgC (DUF456 family)
VAATSEVAATIVVGQAVRVSSIEELIIGIAILVGTVGVVVPVIPGALLVLGAILVWAFQLNNPTGWVTFAVAAAAIGLSQVAKYVVPGRRMQVAGVPNRTILIASLAGIVGFFVIPIVGLFVGFVLGAYVAERHRLGPEPAWPSTKLALRAVGLSILIELTGCLLAAGVWLTAVRST